jgi:hypothetical protein
VATLAARLGTVGSAPGDNGGAKAQRERRTSSAGDGAARDGRDVDE